MTKKNTIIPDDLIQTIEDFKSNLSGQTISIHGKDYATVAHRLAIARRNLGSRMKIETEVVSIDKDAVVCKAAVSIGDKVVATGLAEEKRTASRINQTMKQSLYLYEIKKSLDKYIGLDICDFIQNKKLPNLNDKELALFLQNKIERFNF